MQVSKTGRFILGAMVAVLVCQVGMAVGGTVAYWRFEEGPADAMVAHTLGNGVFEPTVVDHSGNGNDLSAWTAEGWAGEAYRTDVAASTVRLTGAANNFSVQNTGGYPGMFTGSESMRTMTPSAFTVEASFMPENGGYRTIIGRDSRGTATINGDLAALYFQIIPDNAVAVKFCDVQGFWHEAISAAGAVAGFAYPDSAAGHWYHMAAVSDGQKLSLYLNDVDAGGGYKLLVSTDMTTSGSTNTALTAGLGSGGDWVAGTWTVGRGMYAGGHGDRAYGFIDEVRISDSALGVNEFLYAPEPGSLIALALFGALAFGRRRASK